MRSLNYPLQKPLVIRRAVGWGDANLLKPFVSAKDLAKALGIYRWHHAGSLLKQSRILPGARGLLKRLKKRNFKLAVASNRPTRFSRILIRHLRLADYFNYVLCADKLRHGKPHPQILKEIMQKLRVSPQETLYVGDMAIDAQTGRRAGIKTIVVTGGSSSRAQIRREKPFRIIGKISALLRLFA